MSSQRLVQLSYDIFEKSRPLLCIELDKIYPLESMQISWAKYVKHQVNEKIFRVIMMLLFFGIALYLYILCNYINDSANLEGGYTTSNLDGSDNQLPYLGDQGALKIISYEYFLNQIKRIFQMLIVNASIFNYDINSCWDRC